MSFVIRLRDNTYLIAQRRSGGGPMASWNREEAEQFPTRLAALGRAGEGYAVFFDHAVIEPYSPQDAPAANQGPEPSSEGLRTQGGPKAREEEGK